MFPITERFHLSEATVEKLQETPVPWGFGLVSQVVYYRTYSRPKPDGFNEHWPDTVQRVVEGVLSIRKTWYKLVGQRWDERYWQDVADKMADAIFHMRFLPPGRGLWAMGTDYVFERGNAALNNCAYVTINDLAEDPAWLMDQLMLGVGVGFGIPTTRSVFGRQIAAPNPYLFNRDAVAARVASQMTSNGNGGYFIFPSLERELLEQYGYYAIPDSREGWVRSVELLLDSYLYELLLGEQGTTREQKRAITFDYSLIRPEGSAINGFGGKASGPEPLMRLHDLIRQDFELYLHGLIDYTELVADVCNQIGACVVAGNVRRSAQIALGSVHDQTFMQLKNIGKFVDGEWQSGPKARRAAWSWLSNNSVKLVDDQDFLSLPTIAEGIIERGEPGMVNMINVNKFGRYGKEMPDQAVGMNPCGEICLEDYELCNLVEVFPTRCQTVGQFSEALYLATLYASTVSLLPSHDERTNRVVGRNRRIGVSVSGIADWLDATNWPTIHRMLDDGYDLVKRTNEILAAEAGVPASIRVTTVKPSGSVSLLAGVSSGMHHPEFRFGIRRIDVDANHPVAERLLLANVPYDYKVIDQDTMERDYGTLQFEFPMEFGNSKTRSIDEVSVWEQGAILTGLQRVWSDNAVSNTLKIKPSEFNQLERFLSITAPLAKSLAMLVPDDGQYHGMPFEKESRDKYRERVRSLGEVSWDGFRGSDGEDTLYCEGDSCQLPF